QLADRLRDYRPYATAGDHGDVARARAEMARARYAGGDGICTARACRHVELGVWDFPYDAPLARVLVAGAKKLGIGLEPKTIHSSPGPVGSGPGLEVPALLEPWASDYADPAAFTEDYFDSALIGTENDTLVGITPELSARERLFVKGDLEHVPSVDADLRRCA